MSQTKNAFVYVAVNSSIKPRILEWLHFIKVDQNKAKYNISAKDMADGNTANFRGYWKTS